MATNKKAREAIQRVRKNVNESREDIERKVVQGATGFAIGAMKRNGTLNSMPSAFGLPKTVMIAIAANVVAVMAPKGRMKNILNGVGESTTSIAGYEWGQGNSVAGVYGMKTPRQAQRLADPALVNRIEDDLTNQVMGRRSLKEQLLNRMN